MVSSSSSSRPSDYGSLDSFLANPLKRPFILPFEVAKENFIEILNSDTITLENLKRIIRILNATIQENRSDLLFLKKPPLALPYGLFDQEMNLFHIVFNQMLREKDLNVKKQFYDKLLEIFDLLPPSDRTDFLASQSISGRSVMYLAAANTNNVFNLVKEFLVKLPKNARSYCLEVQENLDLFTPLHLIAYKVAKKILRQNLPITSSKKAGIIAACKDYLQQIIAPLSEAEKQRVKDIQDIFGRTYLQVIENIVELDDELKRQMN